MTETAGKLRALVLATVTVFAAFVGPVSVSAETLSGGNAPVSAAGNAEDVVAQDATIDSRTGSTVQIAYETAANPGDLAVILKNADTATTITTKTSGFTSKSDSVAVTIPDQSASGVPSSGAFTMQTVLKDTSNGQTLATDSAAITVDTPPTISGVTLDESSGSMSVSFLSDEQLGGSASDITVAVSGPNGKSYTFDRTQFIGGQTQNDDYVYSLSASQSFDDGDGTYTAVVVNAKDANGLDGGQNGAGSGLSDTYSYSSGPDTTAPTISNVGFSQSNGDMAISFLSDEQLGSNAGDITVAVSGPNGKSYTFDRTQFTGGQTQDGSYVYSLSASQSFDDGTGTYTASVLDAKDAAGNNGGNNGDGSGLTATIDTSSGGSGDGGGGGGEGGGISYPDAPSVQFHTTDIDSNSLTSIFVTYNASGQVSSASDIELWFYNESDDPNTPIAKRTTVEAVKGLTTITIPKDALGAGDFTGKVALVDTSGGSPSVLKTASNKIVVYTGVSLTVQRTTLTNDPSSGIDVQYDLGSIDKSNAKIGLSTTTQNSGFTTMSKTPSSDTGTVTFSQQASGINRNFTVMASVTDTSRGRQVQSSITQTCVEITGSPCPTVVSTSVENAATGETISGVDVGTDWNWFMTGVDWYLHPSGQPNTKEVDGVSGIDSSTMLRVNMTVSHFDPLFLLGNARAQNWSTTQVGDSKTRLTYYVTPADAYWHDQVATPDPNEWPLANASATTHYDAIVDMTQVSLEGKIDDKFRKKLRGGMVATDAQAFAPPQYTAPTNGNPGKLKISVGSPHFQPDGTTTNQGFYRAIIPSGIVSDWGVDTAQLSGNYDGENVPLSVTEGADGTVTVDADIHYSTGTVTLTGDSDKPVPDAGSDLTVDAGTAATLDGSSSSDNGAISKYEWDVDGDDTYEKTGQTVSYTYDSAGSRTVTLRVTDDGGKTATDTVTVDVQAVSSTSSGGSSGGSGSFDSAIAGGSSPDSGDATDTETTTEIEGADDGTLDDTDPVVDRTEERTLIEVPSGSSGSVNVEQSSESRAITVERLRIETTLSQRYQFEVSVHDSNPQSIRGPDTETVGTDPIGYVQVEHTVADDEIDSAALSFTVRERQLETRGLESDQVALYRRHDGSWNQLSTTVLGEADGEYSFESTSPGLSTFAIGAKQPTLSVTAASLTGADGDAPAEADAGESVPVTATVQNTGPVSGTTTVELVAGGTVQASQNVTVAAGATEAVDFDVSFDAAGRYEMRVGNASAGTLVVRRAATPTDTPESTATATATQTAPGTTSGSGPGFGPLATVLALLAAAVLVGRRRHGR